MADRQVRHHHRHRVDPRDIIHAVRIGNVGRPAENIEYGCVELPEQRLVDIQPGDRIGAVSKDAAVVDDDRMDPRVSGCLERLQPAAAMPGHGQLVEIEPMEEGAAAAIILGIGPVDRCDQSGSGGLDRQQLAARGRGLWRCRWRGRRSAGAAQDPARSYGEIAMRSDLGEMESNARPVVRTGTIAPDKQAKLAASQPAQISRVIDDVIGQ